MMFLFSCRETGTRFISSVKPREHFLAYSIFLCYSSFIRDPRREG